jgi:uracil phosphoribosyltransferase
MKLPDLINQRLVLALDPMLATGHSSAAAVTRLKENGAENIQPKLFKSVQTLIRSGLF